MPIIENMTNNRKKGHFFDPMYLMVLSLATIIVPVTLYRTVDEVSSIVAFVVLLFLTLDFYLRYKIQESKRKRYLALKKEEQEILKDFRASKSKIQNR